MATVDLANKKTVVSTENDNVIIVDCFETIRGGRTLDVTGFPNNVIVAGHPIILENEEYKPMPVDGTKGNLAVGVLVGSISKDKAMAAIMVRGSVNAEAFKETAGFEIPAEVKKKLNLVNFL